LISSSKFIVMRVLICFICLSLISLNLVGQKAVVALEGQYSLKDRYQLMKDNSQTFQDYKVIKEVILDGVWKITMDSVSAIEKGLAEAESRINALEDQVKVVERTLQQKEASMAEMEYDSTHVTVAGISLSKSLFLSVTGIVLVGLLFLLGTTAGAVKFLQRSVKEKDLSLFGINAEFDDFRKKALEKEVKLSRELQSERNKLMEFRSSN
jgi:hypothetical protein